MKKVITYRNPIQFLTEFQTYVQDGWTLVTTGYDTPNFAYGLFFTCTVEKEEEEASKPEKRAGRPPKAKE